MSRGEFAVDTVAYVEKDAGQYEMGSGVLLGAPATCFVRHRCVGWCETEREGSEVDQGRVEQVEKGRGDASGRRSSA